MPADAGGAGDGARGDALAAVEGGALASDALGSTGLMVSLHSVTALPYDDGEVKISTAALWIRRLSLISDQGQSAAAELTSWPFDLGPGADPAGLDRVLVSAPPGLYSLVRVQIASADGAPLPDGFAGQPLSIRATGDIGSARSFTISDADSGSIDLRAPVPMELKAGSLLHVIVDVDVSHWLAGLSFDSGNASRPFVVGPEGDGGFRDDLRANVLGSFAVHLAP